MTKKDAFETSFKFDEAEYATYGDVVSMLKTAKFALERQGLSEDEISQARVSILVRVDLQGNPEELTVRGYKNHG